MARVTIKKIPKMDVGGSYLERTPGYTDTRFTYFGNKIANPPKETGETNGTVKPVDRDVADYEAEKGEVLFRNSTDESGRSKNGGLFKITGKKHEQGGTPLVGKPGDFIISDNEELHIPIEHQKQLGLKTSSNTSKKENTPAKVLLRNVDPKKYNSHLSTLMDPNADEIAKNTAAISLEGFNAIIQKVARYQEGDKNQSLSPELSYNQEKYPEEKQFRRGGYIQGSRRYSLSRRADGGPTQEEQSLNSEQFSDIQQQPFGMSMDTRADSMFYANPQQTAFNPNPTDQYQQLSQDMMNQSQDQSQMQNQQPEIEKEAPENVDPALQSQKQQQEQAVEQVKKAQEQSTGVEKQKQGLDDKGKVTGINEPAYVNSTPAPKMSTFNIPGFEKVKKNRTAYYANKIYKAAYNVLKERNLNTGMAAMIAAQSIGETGWYDQFQAVSHNNYTGIKYNKGMKHAKASKTYFSPANEPGGSVPYAQFDSIEDYLNTLLDNSLIRNFPSSLEATTVEDYVKRIHPRKGARYFGNGNPGTPLFEQEEQNYIRTMKDAFKRISPILSMQTQDDLNPADYSPEARKKEKQGITSTKPSTTPTPKRKNGGYALPRADYGMMYDVPPDYIEPIVNRVVIPQVAPGQYSLPGSEWSSNAPDKVVNPYALNIQPQRSAIVGFGAMPTYQQALSTPGQGFPDPNYAFVPTPPSQEVPEDISGGIEMPAAPSKRGAKFDPRTDNGYPMESDVFAGIDQGRTAQGLPILNRSIPTQASRANQLIQTNRPFSSAEPFAEAEGVFNPMDWWSQNSSGYNPNVPQPDLYNVSQDTDPSALGNGPLIGQGSASIIGGNANYVPQIPGGQPDLWEKDANYYPQINPATGKPYGWLTNTPEDNNAEPLPDQHTPPVIPNGDQGVFDPAEWWRTHPGTDNTAVQGQKPPYVFQGRGTTPATNNNNNNSSSTNGSTVAVTPTSATTVPTLDNKGLRPGDTKPIEHVDKYNYPRLRDEGNIGALQALKTGMILNNANKRYLTAPNQYVHTDLRQQQYDPSESIKQAKQQGTLNREMLSRYANPQQAAIALSQAQTADQLAKIQADAAARNVGINNQTNTMNWEDANAIARKNIDAKLQNQMMNNRVLANSQNEMTKALLDQTTYQQYYNNERAKAENLNRIQQQPYGATRKDKFDRTVMEYPFLSNGKFNPNYPGGWEAYAVKQQQLAQNNTLGLPADDTLKSQYGFNEEEIKQLKRDAILKSVAPSKKKKG